jgi:hypothetical protein
MVRWDGSYSGAVARRAAVDPVPFIALRCRPHRSPYRLPVLAQLLPLRPAVLDRAALTALTALTCLALAGCGRERRPTPSPDTVAYASGAP